MSISNCPAYFFVISGGEEDQLSSLCNRCNLSAFEFNAFLIVCNLATLNSRSSTVVIKHDGWEDFIMEQALRPESGCRWYRRWVTVSTYD